MQKYLLSAAFLTLTAISGNSSAIGKVIFGDGLSKAPPFRMKAVAFNPLSQRNLQSRPQIPTQNTKFVPKEVLVEKTDGSINQVKITDGSTVADTVTRLRNTWGVVSAQPNYIYQLNTVNPEDDILFPKQWALENTGQVINGIAGTAGADIKARYAWTLLESIPPTQLQPTIVAVIDTGVAYHHPDLIGTFWNGSTCVNDNNKSVSGGCPNHGWDFDDNNGKGTDKDPAPGSWVYAGGSYYFYHPHGTHVAGIIAANDNTKGILGLNQHTQIMALKTAELTTFEIVKAIRFAKYNKAKVINASWGGYLSDTLLEKAVKNFPGVFVAAAGNEGYDASYMTPCNIDSPNVICVGASDQTDNLSWYSNRGTAVDVIAPGDNILSTVPKTDLLSNNFQKNAVGTLPPAFDKSSATPWQVADITYSNLGSFPGAYYSNVMRAGNSFPYPANANAKLTSKTYAMADAQAADIWFEVGCDTEFNANTWTDFLVLEASGDGGITWGNVVKMDEYTLGGTGKGGYATGYFYGFFAKKFLTNKFKFRFRWVSNGVDNNHGGCFIDNLSLYSYNRGGGYGKYEYWYGTSMATPHVTALAATVFSINPNLTPSQVISIIKDSSDKLPSLTEYSVGGRINALQTVVKAMQSK